MQSVTSWDTRGGEEISERGKHFLNYSMSNSFKICPIHFPVGARIFLGGENFSRGGKFF